LGKTGLSVSNYPECAASDEIIRSDRRANYSMNVILDAENKTIRGRQTLTWINPSSESISSVPLYMYMNAFKNNRSSFLKDANMEVFGQGLANRKPEEWGRIDILNASQEGIDISGEYIRPDDGNPDDQTVMELHLAKPVAAYDTLHLDIEFETKMPKTIARSGYSRNNFFLVVHWYPKIGVYEIDRSGKWEWNCHQFLRQMEFYGDFGNYSVTITTAPDMVLGASGCFIESIDAGNGLVSHIYEASDVIDFAWCAYPDFIRHEETWGHVEIELLSPPHHKSLVPRLMDAVKHSLEYLTEHVGEYPYSKITVMDPPTHALRNGFMEYPTFITGGSFYRFPKGLRSLESLIVHEFSHQYFMATLANNEKEDPWLDEGFVTFYEDCIMEEYYGKGTSLIDLLGYRVGNWELTRNEFTSMTNKRASPITSPSFEIKERFRGIIYSKTALVLKTLENMLGEEAFDQIIRTYYARHAFSHPRKEDFIQSVRDFGPGHNSGYDSLSVMSFLVQALDGTAVCDFAVHGITNIQLDQGTGWFGDSFRSFERVDSFYCSARIHRLHDMVIPVEIEFSFENGHTERHIWNAERNSTLYEFVSESPLECVYIDPDHKIVLDIDFNNNSYSIKTNRAGILKYSSRSIFWLQNIFQSISLFM
jgi:hypothetical protein